MAESIYRRGKHKGFTTVYRSVAQDKRLSLKARGLFLLLQSLPDDWRYTQAGLAHVAGMGRDQIRSALAELEKAGYLTAEQAHDEGGKFSGAVYVLHDEAQDVDGAEESAAETEAHADGAAESGAETEAHADDGPPLSENPTTVENPPLSENPMTGKPTTEKPMTENPTLQNNNINNNNKHTPLTPHGGSGACEPKHSAKEFTAFWKRYRDCSHAVGARAGSRAAAVRAWDKLRPDRETMLAMRRGMDRLFAGDMQRRGIGIPNASTWLNQRRWTDDEDGETVGDAPECGHAAPPVPGGYEL